MRQRNSRYFLRHDSQDGRKYFVMATYRPKAVPEGLLQRFIRTVKTKNVERLRTVLMDAGVVTEVANTLAPHHFHVDKYRAIFEDWCVEWVQPGECRASCSCWVHAWKGHCSHAYTIEEYLPLQAWGHTCPNAERCHRCGLRRGGHTCPEAAPQVRRKPIEANARILARGVGGNSVLIASAWFGGPANRGV